MVQSKSFIGQRLFLLSLFLNQMITQVFFDIIEFVHKKTYRRKEHPHLIQKDDFFFSKKKQEKREILNLSNKSFLWLNVFYNILPETNGSFILRETFIVLNSFQDYSFEVKLLDSTNKNRIFNSLSHIKRLYFFNI